MTFRNIAFIVLVIVLAGLGIYWFISRPTPQETALDNFLDEFRMGHYLKTEQFTADNDFYTMAAATKVRDTDGSQYEIGDYFPERRRAILQISIESYVRPHIAGWRYHPIETQEVGETESVVHFTLEFAIRDFQGGNAMGEVSHGMVEGNAYMRLEGEVWKIERFEFSVFSEGDLRLCSYLDRAGGI